MANYISKKGRVSTEIGTAAQQKARSNAKLRKHFKNRLIIIDEVHNIRVTDDNKDKRVALELLKLVFGSMYKIIFTHIQRNSFDNFHNEIISYSEY